VFSVLSTPFTILFQDQLFFGVLLVFAGNIVLAVAL